MKTIKLPIQNNIEISDIQRIYYSAVRYSYNRLLENLSEKEIRADIKYKFQIGSWLQQCAIKQAVATKASQDELKIPKIVFGTKINLKKRSKNQITQEQWNQSRLLNIVSQGEKLVKGNRLFSFDIVNHNQMIFKPSKDNHQIIQLPKLRKNIKKELCILEQLCNNKEATVQISLSSTHIYFSFEESLTQSEKNISRNNSRVLGIDLNPNYIGYSVLEFKEDDSFEVLYKEVFELKELNKQVSSKKNFEFYQITSRITSIANHYNVSKLVLEELTIGAKDHNKGTNFNKLINNDWNRKILTDSLKKHSKINEIKYLEVNAAYSSTVGNLLYGNSSTPDMVASSIEVARRGHKKYEKGWFYPSLELLKNTKNQWKEDLYSRFESWIEIHREIKNSKMKYRVQLGDCTSDAVFSLGSIKSYINCYSFI